MILRPFHFKSKFARVGVAGFLLVAFFTLFIHHHTHDDDPRDCSVCRVVKQIAALSITAVALLVANAFRRFQFPLNQDYNPLLFASALRDRSPPLLV